MKFLRRMFCKNETGKQELHLPEISEKAKRQLIDELQRSIKSEQDNMIYHEKNYYSAKQKVEISTLSLDRLIGNKS